MSQTNTCAPRARRAARAFAPAARVFAPAARVFAPAARVFAPAARVFAPAARVFAPAARVFAPAARVFAPALCLALASTLCSAADTSVAEQIDAADLEAFLDGVIEARLASHDVAGAAVSVVHGGRMIFAKGYGIDNKDGRAVDANRTLFRPGSISKTFTWTAVMQLVEAGRLDLDADIQTYLPDLVIPATFDRPITMYDLMAHTPGFEDSAIGHLFVDDPDGVLPLAEYLASHQPARVRPPGTLPAYSNYGTALAGLIVANVSGEPFETYVERHLFQPLGMRQSTFREPWGAQRAGTPMSDAHRADMSAGFIHRNGAFEAGTFEFISHTGPAGALAMTATDAARWMLAHLGRGAYAGGRILRAATADTMHTRHFALDPDLPGSAHGFIESTLNGYRAIGHGGGTVHFLSDLQLIPALDFGMFMSTNTTGGGEVISGVAKLVVERYFPPAPGHTAARPEPLDAGQLVQYAGTYLATRRSYTQVERALSMPLVVAAPAGDGYLTLISPVGTLRLGQISPDTFQSTDDPDQRVKFVRDDAGAIDRLLLWIPIMVMERVGLFGNPNLLYGVVTLSVLVFVGALVGAWLRRGRERVQTGTESWAARVTLAACATYLMGLAACLAPLLGALEDLRVVFYDFPQPAFVAGLGLILIAAVLSLGAAGLLVPVWRYRSWPAWRRIRHTVVVVLLIGTTAVLDDLNAIGFHYF